MLLLSLLLCVAVLSTDVLGAPNGRRAREYCRDDTGSSHELGESWEEGIYKCDCLYPESLLYFWDRKNPSDAIPHCLVNGCPNPSGGPLLKNGKSFNNSNGDRCECRRGSNPNLMDAFTLYHARCNCRSDGGSIYYIDFEHL